MRSLVDSMARHRLLADPFSLVAPLHIIHGDSDLDVPLEIAARLCAYASGAPCSMERLRDDDVATLETKTSRLSFERWLYYALVAAKAQK